jgi:hypothetical protein
MRKNRFTYNAPLPVRTLSTRRGVQPSQSGVFVQLDSCDLLRKFLAYSGRGTRDDCPGAEPFLSSATVIFSLRSACLGLVVFVVS